MLAVAVYEDGIVGLFMTTKTQALFQCTVDEHVNEDSPSKIVKKEDIIQDMKARAAVSDFHPVKQMVLVRKYLYRMFHN